MIGGRIVFHDGKLLTLDEGPLRRDAQEAALRLDAAKRRRCAGGSSVCCKICRDVLRGSEVHGSLCAADSWRRLRNLEAQHFQDFV